MKFYPFDVAGAVDFQNRSRTMIGVPPAYVAPPIVGDSGDVATIQGVPLPKLQPASVPGESVKTPTPSYDPSMYGDAIVFPVVFAAAGEQLVLQRPNNTRISLLIVNFTVVGQIFYTFDRVADNVSCVPIPAGGNRLFDFSVPQGELHVFSTGAGTVIIEYINRDIAKESYR